MNRKWVYFSGLSDRLLFDVVCVSAEQSERGASRLQERMEQKFLFNKIFIRAAVGIVLSFPFYIFIHNRLERQRLVVSVQHKNRKIFMQMFDLLT